MLNRNTTTRASELKPSFHIASTPVGSQLRRGTPKEVTRISGSDGGRQQQQQRCDGQCEGGIDAAAGRGCKGAMAAYAFGDGVGGDRRKHLHEPAIGAADELGRGTLVHLAQGHA